MELKRYIQATIKIFPFEFELTLERDYRLCLLKINFFFELGSIFIYPQGLKEFSENFLRELYAYFRGQRSYLDLPHVLPFSGFSQKVLQTLRKIPRGETLTYKALAEKVGNSKSCRAVGQILAKNPLPLIYPCHRVISQKGLGGYSQGNLIKQILLYLESYHSFSFSQRRPIPVLKDEREVPVALKEGAPFFSKENCKTSL